MISIFRKEVAMPDVVTGMDILRKTVAARSKTPHATTTIASEIGVATGTLEPFGAGKVDFQFNVLQKLTKALYPQSELDLESGMLRSANQTPAKSFSCLRQHRSIVGGTIPTRRDSI